MYYNIASRLVPSQLDGNYELVSGYAQQVQQGINDRSGIGLKALRAEPDQDRVDGLVELAANAEDYDSVAGRLMAGMANYLQHTVDETLRANAEFQYDAGLSPKIVRSVNRPCCKWCAALAGTYEYAQVKRQGHDVWRRHENCDCLIEYVAGSGKRETVGNYRRAKDAQGRRDVAATDDREGREERIRLSKAAEGLPSGGGSGIINAEEMLQLSSHNMHNSSDELYDRVRYVPPIEGYDDIYIHGDPMGVSTHDSSGNEVSIPGYEFIELLKSLKLESAAIRLCACQTGALDNGFAAYVAREMGKPVMAPTTPVWIPPPFKSGVTEIRLFEAADTPEGGPDYSKPGRWRLFNPDGTIIEVST